MRPTALRLYVCSITVLVFFVLWAVVAAKPWASASARSAPDPRLVALDRRQRRLEREARVVERTLDRRWSAYRKRLRARRAQIRKLEQRHARAVAAAAAAAAARSTATYSAAPAAVGGTPATSVVTLPPQVKVVTLPPATSAATSSGSSHP